MISRFLTGKARAATGRPAAAIVQEHDLDGRHRNTEEANTG
jgi:hypothetical protein